MDSLACLVDVPFDAPINKPVEISTWTVFCILANHDGVGGFHGDWNSAGSKHIPSHERLRQMLMGARLHELVPSM